MKKFTLGIFILCLFSQVAFARDGSNVGIGASYGVNLVVGEAGPVMLNLSYFYLPINASASFRIEPFFMIYNESKTTQTQGSSLKSESSTTGINIGGGFFYLFQGNKSLVPYLGLRIGYGSTSGSAKTGNSSSDHSQGSLLLGGVLGGDYYLAPNFSLGVEMQLSYINYFEPSNGNYSEYSYSLITSGASIVARLFFN